MVEGGKRERREYMQKCFPTIPLSEELVIDDCSIKMFYPPNFAQLYCLNGFHFDYTLYYPEELFHHTLFKSSHQTSLRV